MTRIHRMMVTALSAAIVMFGVSLALAQEHPEHPATKDSSAHAEHPDQPEHPHKTFKASIETMAMAIKEYVANDTRLKGGYFFIFDPVSNQPLQLSLSKVHEERLAQVGDNLFFACSDFDAKGGKVFDLDFFMQAEDDRLVVTEVMIHKEDGKPRYSWYKENGIWKRK